MSVHAQTHFVPHQLPGYLISALRRHADERPRQLACVHLLNGQADQASLTYAQLDRRARAIAARLQDMGLAGQRVLLVYPPGLDFITAFFGCLYAGCVAVPTYPPHRHRMLDRFHAIAADAGVRIALSTASAAAQFQAMMEARTSDQAATSSQLSVARHRRDSRRLGRAMARTGHRPRHAGHAPVHLRLDQPAQGRHAQSREPHG